MLLNKVKTLFKTLITIEWNGDLADRQGFEPWRRFPAYTLSRRAPSTTRPPVRWGSIYCPLTSDQGDKRRSGIRFFDHWIEPRSDVINHIRYYLLSEPIPLIASLTAAPI